MALSGGRWAVRAAGHVRKAFPSDARGYRLSTARTCLAPGLAGVRIRVGGPALVSTSVGSCAKASTGISRQLSQQEREAR